MVVRARTRRGLRVAFCLFLAGCGRSSDGGSDGGTASAIDGMSSVEGEVSDDEGSPPADGSAPADAAGDDAVSVTDAGGARLVAYTGGYASTISWFSVDGTTGGLSPSGSVASFGSSPSFLAYNAAMTNLYAVDENASGRVGAYAIDGDSGALSFLNAVSSGGKGPAFLSLDRTGKFVLVANYSDGTVAVLPIGASGHVGAATDMRTVGAEAHMIVPDPTNKFVFVPCKGADYVAQFLFDPQSGKLTPNAVPRVVTATGAGPRHIAFHPNGRLAYLINETNSTVSAYTLDTTAGTLTEIETQSTLPAGDAGGNAAAEVWVHPSGRWVLGSNRGADSIVVFSIAPSTGKMTRVGFTQTGGKTPRDFTFDPTGTWLYAADEDSSLVVPFRFDADSGSLTPLGGAVTVPDASFVGVAAL